MTALVAIETVLVVVLVVLVAGLLRSHAEILRRLGPDEAGTIPQPGAPRARSAAFSDGNSEAPAAAPIAGRTLAGDAVKLDFSASGGAPTLLAFLSTGCSVCGSFWQRLGERRLPPEVQTVIVTHGPERESPSKLRAQAPADVPLVMCSSAWRDYEVPGSPYFVLVHGTIRGEGSAASWEGLASLVDDAIADQRLAEAPARARRVDERLATAGIGADHPSLYPGKE